VARTGSFSGPTEPYAQPLSVVKPPDNVQAAQYSTAIMDPSLQLTESQKSDLQGKIDDLFGLLRTVSKLPNG
jgi:hypothetical protein